MYKLIITKTRPNTNVAWYKDYAPQEKIIAQEKYYTEKYVETGKIDADFDFDETELILTITRYSGVRDNLVELENEFKDPTSPLYARTKYFEENSIVVTNTIATVA